MTWQRLPRMDPVTFHADPSAPRVEVRRHGYVVTEEGVGVTFASLEHVGTRWESWVTDGRKVCVTIGPDGRAIDRLLLVEDHDTGDEA